LIIEACVVYLGWMDMRTDRWKNRHLYSYMKCQCDIQQKYLFNNIYVFKLHNTKFRWENSFFNEGLLWPVKFEKTKITDDMSHLRWVGAVGAQETFSGWTARTLRTETKPDRRQVKLTKLGFSDLNIFHQG